jgi:hypothetical protein
MTPAAVIEHQLPKRTRLRIPSKRGDASFFASIGQRLAEIPGVERARANTLTGHVVLEQARAFDAIAADAARNGIFELRRSTEKPDTSGRGVPPSEAGTLSMFALGFTGMGAYQLAQGRVAGSAVENFWNAYGSYRTLEQPWLAALLVGCGLYQLLNGELLGSAASLFFYAASARYMARTKDPEAIA